VIRLHILSRCGPVTVGRTKAERRPVTVPDPSVPVARSWSSVVPLPGAVPHAPQPLNVLLGITFCA
ncbi:hypothetical protein, partial [Acinetobacter baumannii]|uniref:hypothetical protein n=1 Tax=Acinetobacter baumannii TaxID=470 RepID=UPI001BC88B50